MWLCERVRVVVACSHTLHDTTWHNVLHFTLHSAHTHTPTCIVPVQKPGVTMSTHAPKRCVRFVCEVVFIVVECVEVRARRPSRWAERVWGWYRREWAVGRGQWVAIRMRCESRRVHTHAAITRCNHKHTYYSTLHSTHLSGAVC